MIVIAETIKFNKYFISVSVVYTERVITVFSVSALTEQVVYSV